jgi:hypothetical protein
MDNNTTLPCALTKHHAVIIQAVAQRYTAELSWLMLHCLTRKKIPRNTCVI